MGVSTDGILFFGIDLGEFDDTPFRDEDGDLAFEEFVAKEQGWAGHPLPEYDFTGKREFELKSPVALVSHCSYDYPMYGIAVRGTVVSARRGSAEKIGWDHLDHTKELAEKVAAAKEWCEKHGIEWNNPGWHLCSLWG